MEEDISYGGSYLQTQQTVLETDQYTPGTKQTLFQTQRRIIETERNFTETQHDIIETQQKFMETQHSIIETRYLQTMHNTIFAKHKTKCSRLRNAGFVTSYRVFSLTWATSLQLYWNKRKRLHKKRV